MKLYLSGPMTLIANFNFPQFDEVRDVLRAQDHVVYSPADHDREVIERLWPGKRPEDFDGYATGNITRYFDEVSHGGQFQLDNMMAWDLNTIVNDVDGIVMLPGWERSSGGLAERYAAEAVSKVVYLATHDYHLSPRWTFRPDHEQQYLRKQLKQALTPVVVSLEQAGR